MAWLADRRSHFYTDGEYYFTLIALFVGLGTLWQFPFFIYQYGGVVFLIPFAISMLIFGLPYVTLALDFGQYALAGPVVAFRDILPGFIGVGIVQALLQFIITAYYSITATHILYYAYVVCTNFNELPWSTCNNWWNAAACNNGSSSSSDGNQQLIELIKNGTFALDSSNNTSVVYSIIRQTPPPATNLTADEVFAASRAASPQVQFFERAILRANQLGLAPANASLAHTFFIVGPVLGHLVLTHLVTWGIIFAGVMLGIVLLGTVCVFTTIASYVLLSVVFIRFVILPGADDGVKAFFQPDISAGLGQYQPWIQAANITFVMLALGRGVLVMIGSYQRRALELKRCLPYSYGPTNNEVPTRPVSPRYNGHPSSQRITTTTVTTTSFAVSPRSGLRYAVVSCAVLFCTCLYFTLIHASLVGVVAFDQISRTAISDENYSAFFDNVVARNLTDFFARIVPAATSTVPLSSLWALFIYIAMFMLCIDGIMLSAETTLSSIRDWQMTSASRYLNFQSFFARPVMAFIYCSLSYALGLCMLTPAGVYVQQWFDMLITLPELIASMFAIIAYTWVFIVRRRIQTQLMRQLVEHQAQQSHHYHGRNLVKTFLAKTQTVRFVLMSIISTFCVVIIGALVYQRTPVIDRDWWYYMEYSYPLGSKIILWILVAAILAVMPVAAVVQWLRLRLRAFQVVYTDRLLNSYESGGGYSAYDGPAAAAAGGGAAFAPRDARMHVYLTGGVGNNNLITRQDSINMRASAAAAAAADASSVASYPMPATIAAAANGVLHMRNRVNGGYEEQQQQEQWQAQADTLWEDDGEATDSTNNHNIHRYVREHRRQ